MSFVQTPAGVIVPEALFAQPLRLGSEHTDQVASIERDFTQMLGAGGTLPNNDETLRKRGGGKGLAVYDEIERDAHCWAVLQTRALAVVARPWVVDPATEDPQDQAAAALVRMVLEGFNFDRACLGLLDATLKGFAVGEVMWEIRDNLIQPDRIIPRDQRRFVFDKDAKLRLLTRANMLAGEELPERKFVVHTSGGKDGSPYGLGLGTRLFWPAWFKRQDMTFWLTFADKFGSPTALGRYPNGASADEQTKLLNVLRAISHDAGVIVPEGMVIELLEAARSGSADCYERLARYMDEQISECVLGQTLTTNIGTVGSKAASETHDGVRLEIAKADADLLSDTLNAQLVQWIIDFNMPGARPPRVRRNFEKPDDLDKRADRDTKVYQLGFEPNLKYILDNYGPGWTKKAGTPPGDIAPPDPLAAFAEPSQARSRNRADQSAMADAADSLTADWQRLIGKRVADLTAVLEESGDLVGFREQLGRLLETEPPDALVEALARAQFAANLVGRNKTGG